MKKNSIMKLINMNYFTPVWIMLIILATALNEANADRVYELIKQLNDRNLNTRRCAVQTLGEIGDSRAVEALIVSLDYNDKDVRKSAVEALGKIGDSRAVDPLIACLKDTTTIFACWDTTDFLGYRYSYRICDFAAEALIKIGESSVEGLIVCLEDNDKNVRKYAAEALDKIGYTTFSDNEKIIYLIAKQNWEILIQIGKSAVAPLINCLMDKNDNVRQSAASALGNIGDSLAVEPLIFSLKDKCGKVRYSAADALGKLGDKNAVPHLILALPDWDANNAIFSALIKLNWSPINDNEIVYSWIAAKDKNNLISHWEQTKYVLLNDAKSGKRRKIENAVNSLISLGREEIINDLIRILNTNGSKEIAETFLNCGNSELYRAARSWAAEHDYSIMSGSGNYKAGWGEW